MKEETWIQNNLPEQLLASDSEEVVTPLMLDGTYLSRNYQLKLRSYPWHHWILGSLGLSRDEGTEE